ncbi:MAG: hypothetical protein H7Z75_09985 [Ferruginibacter sp.]|nr:hypothetical protein [Cytophagales bacterium]
MKKRLLLVALSALLAAACQQSRNTGSTVSADSLKTVYLALNDSVTANWKRLTDSDDEKISDVKRLLQEISHTTVHNRALLDSLVRMQATLTAKRYTMETMVSEQIDAYDLATDSLVQRIPRLMASVPDLESYPLCAELSQEIDSAGQAVLLHRIHYDKYAKLHNQFIREHAADLQKTGYANQKPKPLFQLGA